jgi:hypothetical protein
MMEFIENVIGVIIIVVTMAVCILLIVGMIDEDG